MATGVITQLMSETSTGLIREDGREQDIFFHAAALIEGTFDRLSEGQTVAFEHKSYRAKSDKTRAVNVRPVGAASPTS